MNALMFGWEFPPSHTWRTRDRQLRSDKGDVTTGRHAYHLRDTPSPGRRGSEFPSHHRSEQCADCVEGDELGPRESADWPYDAP